MHRLATLIIAFTALLQAGCQSTTPGGAPRPARLNHVVLFTLHDPDDADAFIIDCDEHLPSIPAVSAYAAGPPLPTEREVAVMDYDVGLYLGFESREGLQSYLAHPSHEALVGAWQSRIRRMRVIDILDETR